MVYVSFIYLFFKFIYYFLMNEKGRLPLSSSEKLIVKYKKKNYSFPNCLNIILLVLLLLSILSLFALSNIKKAQEKEKLIFNNEYINKQYLIDNIDKTIKLIANNISFYKKEIKSLNNEYNNLTSIYLKKISELKTKTNLLKYLNIELSYLNIIPISSILKNLSQIKQIISYIQNNINYFPSDYHPNFKQIYKSSLDKKKRKNFINEIIGKNYILILVKTSEDNIFGGFFNKIISGNSSHIDNSAFLFSLNHEEVYKINLGKKPYWFNTDIFFSFGENDIILYNDCFENYSSISSFPSSYGNNSCIQHRLTEGKKYFVVKEIEVYQLNNE